jgi:putative ABC transport system permease protein
MNSDLSRWRLAWKGLLQHRRSHLAVALSTVIAAAVITGALIVGDSIRGSLEGRVRERLGEVDHALVAPRFFREELASLLAAEDGGVVRKSVGVILLRGAVVAADSQRRLGDVNVIGVDEHFWDLWTGTRPAGLEGAPGLRRAIVNATVAASLGATPGTALLVYTSREGEIPSESAFGRREGTVRPMRVELERVLPDEGLALFGLRHGQTAPRNVFVSRSGLAQLLKKRNQINTLLVDVEDDEAEEDSALDARLRAVWSLDDAGLRVDVRTDQGYAALESEELLLPESVATAAREIAATTGVEFLEVLTYLANTVASDGGEIPYSTVSAISHWQTLSGGSAAPVDPSETNAATDRPSALPGSAMSLLEEPGGILLSQWASPDFEPLSVGDKVTLRYYAPAVEEEVETRSAEFTFRGFIPLEGAAAEPGWTPTYPGITDSINLRDWDPPFPVDMKRIRERDEDFWDKHRATPKAFVALKDGQELWSSRFGTLTSIRLRSASGAELGPLVATFREALRVRLAPQELGWSWLALKREGLAAARSGTDFTGLFIGFSFFLIIAALVLLSIVFRLSCDNRARELGVLAAGGFAPRDLVRTVLTETGLVMACGAALGSACGLAYASALVAGLRGWWKGAVNAPFLSVHVYPLTVAAGGIAAVLLALSTVYLSVRRLSRLRPARLVAGSTGDEWVPAQTRRSGVSFAVAVGGLLAGLVLLSLGAGTGVVPPAAAFFLAGGCLLASGLAWVHVMFGRKPPALDGSGFAAVATLGVRNWSRSPARSVLTVALLACATFTIVAVGASRRQPGTGAPEKDSGDGGFALVGRAALPIYSSLMSVDGRESLGLRSETNTLLGRAKVFPFRSRAGDDASCLNIYRPQTPRLLGAPAAFIDRAGFAWAGSLAKTDAEENLPWQLLNHRFPDGAIPAIGDAATVKWILHSGLGQDIELENDRGQDVRLRLVALAAHSIFQGELIISRDSFLEHFPDSPGDRFYLVEAPPADVDALTTHLEKDLADYGLDLETTGALLANYQSVENTYLSTFQVLGGLGLVLGTLGLAAVLYRNSIERRGELALLRAVGFPRRTLAWMVLSETSFLLALGVAVGAAAALVGVVPQQGIRHVPWAGLAVTLLGTVLIGLLAATVSVRAALASPLLPALREE